MRSVSGRCSSFALATILAIGFATVWGVIVIWGRDTVRSFGPPTVEEALLVRADGTPVVERFCYVNGKSIVPRREQFRDLAGNRVDVADDAEWAPGVVLYPGGTGEGLLAGLLSLEESWDYRVLQLSDAHDGHSWYFISDGQRHGSAYFVAYDTQGAQRVGYLGTAGFRPAALPAEERFPFDGSARGVHFRILNQRPYGRFLPLERLARQSRPAAPAPTYVQADNDKIYQVDLQTQTVRVAFEGQPVHSAGLLTRTAPGPGAGRTFLGVCTEDAVLELDGPNRIVRRFPIPEELREHGFVWFETSSGEIVTLANVDYDARSSQALWHVSWFDGAGRLLRREQTWIQWPTQPDRRVFLGGMLSPAAGNWIVSDPLNIPYHRRWSEYLKVLRRQFAECWPVLLVVHLAAAGLAVLCYRRLVRYRASRRERIAWPIFVFVLGLPGWVGFRFGRSWPALERCPACGAVVPRDRADCAGCRAEYPLPALTGTEVFV